MPLAVQKLEGLGSSSGGGSEEAIGALQKTIAELEEKINAEERQIEETKAKVRRGFRFGNRNSGPAFGQKFARTFLKRQFLRLKFERGCGRLLSRPSFSHPCFPFTFLPPPKFASYKLDMAAILPASRLKLWGCCCVFGCRG